MIVGTYHFFRETATGPEGQDQKDTAPAGSPEWMTYPSAAGPFSFPDDEGAHPQATEEWWYVNGHLTGPDGTAYDFMVCFFDRGIIAAALYDGSSGSYLNHSETWNGAVKETGRLGLDSEGSLRRAGIGREAPSLSGARRALMV